jgi:cytochrome bd-type quinol oxidase subunit 2
MGTEAIKQENKVELITWVLGIMGLLLVVISRSNTAAGGFLPVKSYPYLLVISMVLMGVSLFLKLKRESKKKKFSIFLYSREILRTVIGLAIAVYYLIDGKGI